jgi:hypothetical protein
MPPSAAETETPWQQDSANAQTPDTPTGVISTGGPHEYRIVRGEDGQVWWTIWHRDNWQRIPGGWHTPAAPAVALVNGQLWVFVRGQDDDRVYVNRLVDLESNTWQGWQAVPGTEGTSGSPSVTVAANDVWLFTNIDGALYYHRYSTNGLIGWHEVRQVVPGNALSPSSPGVTTYGVDRDRIAVFHRGVNDRLYRQNLDALNRRWQGSWRDLGGRILSRPTTAATGNLLDTVAVAVRGTDDRSWLITFGNGGDDVTYGWHPIQGSEGATRAAPYLFANIARAAIYILITQRLTNQIWGKRVQ